MRKAINKMPMMRKKKKAFRKIPISNVVFIVGV